MKQGYRKSKRRAMAGLFLMATAGLLSTGAEVPQQMLVKLRDGGSISIGLDQIGRAHV